MAARHAHVRKPSPGRQRAGRGGWAASPDTGAGQHRGTGGGGGGSSLAEVHGGPSPKGVCLGHLNVELHHATTGVEGNFADQEVDGQVKLGWGRNAGGQRWLTVEGVCTEGAVW